MKKLKQFGLITEELKNEKECFVIENYSGGHKKSLINGLNLKKTMHTSWITIILIKITSALG